MTDSDKGGMRQAGWYVCLPAADLYQLHLIHARLMKEAVADHWLLAADLFPLLDLVAGFLPETDVMNYLKESHGRH